MIVDASSLVRVCIGFMARSIWQSIGIVEAECLSQAQQALRRGPRPDLVVLEPHLPGADGLSALRALRDEFPQTPVLVYASSRDANIEAMSLSLGAAAFVSKTAVMSAVASAMRDAVS